MKINKLWILCLLILCSCSTKNEEDIVSRGFERAELQLSAQLKVVPEPNEYPRTIKGGKLKTTKKNDWTEGFYPGCLWYVYEHNHNENWKESAIKWTEALEPLKKLTNHHDIGFLMYCSFGNAYRLTGNETYKDILVESARSLCTRFNQKTGCIESWNYRKAWNGIDEWFYPVIIDNMMNLELLFWATQATGDSTFYDIAVKHADTTLKNHFRADNSLYHGLNYNPETGEIKHYQGGQGFSEKSAWARGQAWGLYGYTLMYRFTKERKYLEQAIKIAEFTLNHPNMPKDLIPYWDYNAPGIPDALRDASAAAINCSGLLELSQYVSEERAKKYYKAAEKMLQTLSSPAYTAEEGTNGGFILKHSVGNIPSGTEVDMPLTYADYYYVEALCRYKSLNDKP